MTASPLVIASLVFACAAPLSAQQWGGGGVPTTPARTHATLVTPWVFLRPMQVIVVDPTLSVAPFVDPRTVPAPRATGGGTWGPTPISTWGGSPPPPTSASRGTAEQPWFSPYLHTTSGRVITSSTYRLPADSAQHATAKTRRP